MSNFPHRFQRMGHKIPQARRHLRVDRLLLAEQNVQIADGLVQRGQGLCQLPKFFEPGSRFHSHPPGQIDVPPPVLFCFLQRGQRPATVTGQQVDALLCRVQQDDVEMAGPLGLGCVHCSL